LYFADEKDIAVREEWAETPRATDAIKPALPNQTRPNLTAKEDAQSSKD
jgi:hypothetical protein